MRAVAERYVNRLLPESPYKGFPAEEYPTDLTGWGQHHPVLDLAIELVRPRLVIEVGSWKGASAITFASALKNHGIDGCVLCVDTWLGSPEHLRTPKRNRHTPSLRHKWGYPQIYYTFLSNVVASGHSDLIVPYPATSENASVVFKRKGIVADIVYVDAAHEYEAVMRDLIAYWEIVREGGLLIGDDYLGWEGVTRAAREFSATRQIRLVGGHGKFVLAKGDMPVEITELFDVLETKRLLKESKAEGTPNPGPDCSASAANPTKEPADE